MKIYCYYCDLVGLVVKVGRVLTPLYIRKIGHVTATVYCMVQHCG